MSDEKLSQPIVDNFARHFALPELYDPAKREWKFGRYDEDYRTDRNKPNRKPKEGIDE